MRRTHAHRANVRHVRCQPTLYQPRSLLAQRIVCDYGSGACFFFSACAAAGQVTYLLSLFVYGEVKPPETHNPPSPTPRVSESSQPFFSPKTKTWSPYCLSRLSWCLCPVARPTHPEMSDVTLWTMTPVPRTERSCFSGSVAARLALNPPT